MNYLQEIHQVVVPLLFQTLPMHLPLLLLHSRVLTRIFQDFVYDFAIFLHAILNFFAILKWSLGDSVSQQQQQQQHQQQQQQQHAVYNAVLLLLMDIVGIYNMSLLTLSQQMVLILNSFSFSIFVFFFFCIYSFRNFNTNLRLGQTPIAKDHK